MGPYLPPTAGVCYLRKSINIELKFLTVVMGSYCESSSWLPALFYCRFSLLSGTELLVYTTKEWFLVFIFLLLLSMITGAPRIPWECAFHGTMLAFFPIKISVFKFSPLPSTALSFPLLSCPCPFPFPVAPHHSSPLSFPDISGDFFLTYFMHSPGNSSSPTMSGNWGRLQSVLGEC